MCDDTHRAVYTNSVFDGDFSWLKFSLDNFFHFHGRFSRECYDPPESSCIPHLQCSIVNGHVACSLACSRVCFVGADTSVNTDSSNAEQRGNISLQYMQLHDVTRMKPFREQFSMRSWNQIFKVVPG